MKDDKPISYLKSDRSLHSSLGFFLNGIASSFDSSMALASTVNSGIVILDVQVKKT